MNVTVNLPWGAATTSPRSLISWPDLVEAWPEAKDMDYEDARRSMPGEVVEFLLADKAQRTVDLLNEERGRRVKAEAELAAVRKVLRDCLPSSLFEEAS